MHWSLRISHSERAVFALVLVELDQVPVIPRRLRHGLVGVVEDGLAERHVVPLQTGDFAGLAADTGGRVDAACRPASSRCAPFARDAGPAWAEIAWICRVA